MGKSTISMAMFMFKSYVSLRGYIYWTGWWYTYPSEKYELVSWDDYSQLNGKS